jgi:tetratricopeptide (TPR) repeat protein
LHHDDSTLLLPIEVEMKAGNWKRAHKLCASMVAEHPTSARAQAYLGWTLIQLGQFEAAVEPLERATALSPDFWQASLVHARNLDRLGRYADALRHARAALTQKPGNSHIEGLVRGLQRQVPEEITDAWQISAKPMFHAVSMPNEPD